MFSRRHGARVALLTGGLLSLVVVLGPAASGARAQATVVSLSFDGATTDQTVAAAMLAARGLPGTFFVSSGQIATAGHLDWPDLRALAAAGHEIGGATTTAAWLPGLTIEQARHEVCDDRDTLLGQGFAVRSFAHPYRDSTPETQAIVRECGYASARGGGGFSHDLLPPRNPYSTLTPAAAGASSTAAGLDALVQETIDDDGGWLTFQIGRVCAACGPDAIAPDVLAALLDRLAARRDAATIAVRRVGDAVAGPLEPPAHLPRGETTVSLTFDDGSADEYQLKGMLAARGMRATLYVNSATIGTPGFLTWTQLTALQTAGHEIGGHTVDHPADLTALEPERQVAEVCDDRAALLARGLRVTNFAYPHSRHVAATEAIVAGCGYNSGRTVGGLQCQACTYAETFPPRSPFNMLAADEVLSSTPLAELQRRVTTAESLGGGWVPIVFHRLCTTPCGPYGLAPATLTQFVDWLAARRASGTVVRTVADVVGGPVVASPDATPPATSATCDGVPCVPWVGGRVRVALSATDAGSGVREVRYTTSGSAPTSSSPLYAQSLSFSSSTDLRFRAWDIAGNAEAERLLRVGIDTDDPHATLTAPSSGASLSAGSPVTLRATATDSDSGVRSVAFRLDGKLISTAGPAPYAATWTPAASDRGNGSLTVVATDAVGRTVTSPKVGVKVR